MTTFKSKIDALILIPVFSLLSIIAGIMIYERLWIGLILVTLTLLFSAFVIFTITYQIHQQQLIVRCAYYTYPPIDILGIKKISSTKNFVSAPAASLDRIEIRYNQYDHIIIAPKNQQLFLEKLLEINPSIVLNMK